VAGFYNTRNTLTQNTLRKDNDIPIFWGAFRVVRVLYLIMLVRGTIMSLETSNKMKSLVLGHSFLLIFCFLRSYALRLKPHGFLRQQTDPTITVETWYFSNSTDTSRFILTRIRVGEESFKCHYRLLAGKPHQDV
jgi:hypothetical protein